jgi:transketolase
MRGNVRLPAHAGGSLQGGEFASSIRRTIIECSRRADVGHIGSCLSIADILAALYGDVLEVSPGDPERDRFVLSKGHAALALYAALVALGAISEGELDSFCTDGGSLATHPEHVATAIDFSTGSLGHGLSIGAGAALAARLQGSERRVFVLVSDAECNEGSLWEAVMFASHHRLSNLIAIVDSNGQQALGRTRDVLNLEPLPARWRAFGWDVLEVDGHDVQALTETLNHCDATAGPPHVLVASTIFGKGVSFMEGEIPWHYLPLNDEQYRAALRELESVSS